MCDHSSIINLEINRLQISDGNVRYTCILCKGTVVKNVDEDAEFNRFYKRSNGLCVNHEDLYVPSYVNIRGNKCCTWCGTELMYKK